jgi:hypothetical protein
MTVEVTSKNTIPNVVSWRTQVAMLGCPMKNKEQKVRKMSRM